MNYALILAGGSGTRAGGALPKQFQIINGKRMLWWSIEAFKAFDPDCSIILALPKDYIGKWEEMLGEEEKKLGSEIIKVEGGKTRFHSVKNALEALPDKEGTIFIHDGARPLVTPELIERGARHVSKGKGAVPVIPVTDSLRKITKEGSESVNRADYVSVQTPQIFMVEDIRMAYKEADDTGEFTDDASVAESIGLEIVTFPGDTKNIKVTNPEDFKRI